MCRNIRTLHNFEPPATEKEMADAALQYVRKISGYRKVPQVNQVVFDQAVEAIFSVTRELVEKLAPTADPKNREVEIEKARARFKKRASSS